MEHKDNKHEKKKFICTECHKQFGTINALKQHCRDTNHKGIYICKVCNKYFLEEKSLIQHQVAKQHLQSKLRDMRLAQVREIIGYKPKAHKANPDEPISEELKQTISAAKLLAKKRKEAKIKAQLNRPKTLTPNPFGEHTHEFRVLEHALVGFGPGNGGNVRDDEGIERCIYCGKTKKRIERGEEKKENLFSK